MGCRSIPACPFRQWPEFFQFYRFLARQRAEDILDRLDELRHGLLMGALSRRQIENLARLIRLKRESISDPRLVDILD